MFMLSRFGHAMTVFEILCFAIRQSRTNILYASQNIIPMTAKAPARTMNKNQSALLSIILSTSVYDSLT